MLSARYWYYDYMTLKATFEVPFGEDQPLLSDADSERKQIRQITISIYFNPLYTVKARIV